ncbi:Hypothetical Protein FCC1311_084852 [Hondaea fermentalgiana]|uniref:Uncharacterized protein n=1 Tax=Hondaea fermentalgiana TaxID=2315210 RepID=A0A2R5GMZ2_9STRA|nr:Hypothetical Protein FCC1311_084852 [Hondaea fermentalgiana]|eukprot:GBG32260.1 Hypothetical Protein FCC1311_084852 [Hondaea fermentalgiana]
MAQRHLARRLGGGVAVLAAVGTAAWHKDELVQLTNRRDLWPGSAGARPQENREDLSSDTPAAAAAAAAVAVTAVTAETPTEMLQSTEASPARPSEDKSGAKPKWARELPVPAPGFSRALQDLRPPDMSGQWMIDQERSQHDEMIDIMTAIGVPGYLLRMGRWSPSRMTVEQAENDALITERITQLGGMYTNVVELFIDGREVIGKQPLDGSSVVTVTLWERFLARELEPCNLGPDPDAVVVCCVSYGEYGK